jgi:hypothetical protein
VLGESRHDRLVTKGNHDGRPPDIIIGRAEARALGLKRYFTGKPCKHGHVAERSVSGGCMECNRGHDREWRAANPEKDRERKRLHYAKNKDKLLSRRAAKRAANPQKAREYQRVWRAANRDELNKRRAAQRRAANISKRRAARPRAARRIRA